jgi:hypothetical protein
MSTQSPYHETSRPACAWDVRLRCEGTHTLVRSQMPAIAFPDSSVAQLWVVGNGYRRLNELCCAWLMYMGCALAAA